MKLNKLLCNIEKHIVSNYDTMDECISELQRYKKEFPHELDYNYVQYGNMLIYYEQVKDFYTACGYKRIGRYSDDKIWDIYRKQVGYVMRRIVNEK